MSSSSSFSRSLSLSLSSTSSSSHTLTSNEENSSFLTEIYRLQDLLRRIAQQPLVIARPISLSALHAFGEISYLIRLSAVQLKNLCHGIYTRTPPRETWPLHFHLLMILMRTAMNRPDVNMPRMRLTTCLLYTPVPLTVRITSVRFDVRQKELLTPERNVMRARGARGYATVPSETGRTSQCDAYQLNGEWIEYRGKQRKPPSKKMILYLHGGGYTILSAKTHRGMTYRIARATGARLFALNYRLAPEDPFPAAVHDAFAAYLYLTAPDHPAVNQGNHRRIHEPVRPEDIIVMGDSAGGGLSLALMIYLRDYVSLSKSKMTFGMVGGAMLCSPWVDLQCASESWHTNSVFDYLPLHPGSIDGIFYTNASSPVRIYLWGSKPIPKKGIPSRGPSMEYLAKHPLASPIYADMSGLPPMLIQAGDAEVLRDECRLLAHKASMCGVRVRHELYKDMTHVWQAFPFMTSAKTAYVRQAEFFQSLCEDRKPSSFEQRSHHQPHRRRNRNREGEAGGGGGGGGGEGGGGEGTPPVPAEWVIFDHVGKSSQEAAEATEAAAAAVVRLLMMNNKPLSRYLERGDSGIDTDGDPKSFPFLLPPHSSSSSPSFCSDDDDDYDDDDYEGSPENAEECAATSLPISSSAVGSIQDAELLSMKCRTIDVYPLSNLVGGIVRTPFSIAEKLTSLAFRAISETAGLNFFIDAERTESDCWEPIKDVEFDKTVDEYATAMDRFEL